MSFMQSLFGGGSPALIGLDISSSSVTLLDHDKPGNGYKVETYALELLPPNEVKPKPIVRPHLVDDRR